MIISSANGVPLDFLAALRTKDKNEIIEAAKQHANSDIRPSINAALEMIDQPNTTVVEYFGTRFHLPDELSQNAHLIANCDNFVKAIRLNILADGNNVGRSIMIG